MSGRVRGCFCYIYIVDQVLEFEERLDFNLDVRVYEKMEL